MTTPPKVYLAATYTDPLTLLTTTHAAAGAALDTLHLCPAARTWTPLQLTQPEQLRDHSIREHAHALIAHQPDHEHCTCDPTDLHAAATIAEQWLHHWKVTLAHTTHADVHDAGLVRAAAQLVTDYAAFLVTRNPDHLIPAPPPAHVQQKPPHLSAWFLPPRDHRSPALAATAPHR
jgi:hypothetical protein